MTKAATLLSATALCTVGSLGIGTATASAATPDAQASMVQGQVTLVQSSGGNYWHLVAAGGAGEAIWSQDPANGDPGDALRAYDGLADGLGIHAYLSDGRMASTAGHASPYYSPWVTGDLPEGNWYRMTVCTEKSGVDISCYYADVQA
ncbi:hypothetical protein [Streptomyces sp. NK08204]|uniref:hypothetical protein n=1 Tax=Streptomyces sp. NK08204 TaxID=2873260 RepID=UPI001CECD152|nr:hypothetical protein [Streptomyces sp. NK08204]